MEEDYYKILGVDKNADDDEINKAYKRLSKIHHPDKNPNNKVEAEEKFKKINEAKNILLDKEKRKLYDDFGHEGLKANTRPDQGNFNPFDIFSNMFGGGGHPFGGNPFGFRQNFNQEPETKIYRQFFDEQITLEQVYAGCKIHKKLKIHQDCNKCEGFGKKNVEMCKSCSGRGSTVRVQQMGNMITQMSIQCDSCKGKGKVGSGSFCDTCNGSKSVTKLVEIDVDFPKNTINGSTYMHKIDNYELIFKANIKEHNLFRRSNMYDLQHTRKITLREALCGFSFKLKMLDEKEVVIQSNTVIKPNTTYTVENLGFMNGSQRGNLIINFEIEFPSSFSKEEIEILDEIFKCQNKTVENNEHVYLIK